MVQRASVRSSEAELRSINRVALHILKRLLQDSQSRQARSASALYDAYTSLKACPVAFGSVNELRQLSGFESSALRLDLQRRVTAYCTEHGKRLPNAEACSSTEASSSKLDGATMASGPEKRHDGVSVHPERVQAKRAGRSVQPKLYVPQTRTGSYGILVALLALTPSLPGDDGRESQLTDDCTATAYHSKATIIAHAQQFSDAKYVPKKSSSGFGRGPLTFHSAWSGMKTLVNRGYVYRTGNPARFCLSPEGWEVAKICAGREEGISPGCQAGTEMGTTAIDDSNDDRNIQDDNDQRKSKAERRARKNKAHSGATIGHEADGGQPFLHAFVTQSVPALRTRRREEASMRLSERDYCILYRIIFPVSQALHPFAVSCVEQAQNDPGDPSMLIGWVKESACNVEAPGLPHGVQESHDVIRTTEDACKNGSASAPTGELLVGKASAAIANKKPRKQREVKRKNGSDDFLDTSSSVDEEGEYPVSHHRTVLMPLNVAQRRRRKSRLQQDDPSGSGTFCNDRRVHVSVNLLTSSDNEVADAQWQNRQEHVQTKGQADVVPTKDSPLCISSDADLSHTDDAPPSPIRRVHRMRKALRVG